jgi:glucosamine kinase
MRILIADSGSTKCDWLLLEGEKVVLECNTMGLNPYFHDEATIEGALRGQPELAGRALDVDQVYFYGAGASSPELKAIVKRGLALVFTRAKIQIGHDLDAAALATYTGVPHIACILGTGSNSCFFDGTAIHEEVPALAYILGDEGGGSYFGKRLLADFFYKRMPPHLAAEFKERYNMNMQTMAEKVYIEAHANVYLASLSRFCWEHLEEPYMKAMVRDGLRTFLQVHVACYADYQKVPVDFVGSIAYYFEAELREVAEEMGIGIGTVVKKPIHGLVKYHQRFSLSQAG